MMWKLGVLGTCCGLLLGGCVAEPKGDAELEAASANGSSTGGFEPGSDTGTKEDPPATDTGVSEESGAGATFIVMDTDDGVAPQCNVWTQDCPDGEKCSAVIQGGGAAWNSSACVSVLDNPATPGASCTAISTVTGEDDCEIGSMCWGVGEDGTGYCVALCTGDANAPLCDDPETSCVIVNEGFLNLCLPDCHPLLQDCQADGESCYPAPAGFACAPDVSQGAGAGEVCSGINTCVGGTFCVGADQIPACDGPLCCTEFCDTDEEDACQGGAQCIGLYELGEAPPGLATVGGCLLP